jgi:hypothetical protein
MTELFLRFIALALITSGCTTSSRDTIGAGAATALSPTQLITSIGAHKGRTVTVAGYFTYVVDTRALWENENAHRDAEKLRKGSWDKCITIYPTRGDARQFNGRRVHITGKATVIEKGDIRSLWTCNPVALEDALISLG